MSILPPSRPGPTATAAMREVWRKVPACRWFGIKAGVFETSSLGRVRTVDRTLTDGRRAGGIVLSPTPDGDGYPRVEHRRRKIRVATLVCLAWHGVPEVRHMNDNRSDSKPGNLAWGSRRDNERDKKREAGRKNRTRDPSVLNWDLRDR